MSEDKGNDIILFTFEFKPRDPARKPVAKAVTSCCRTHGNARAVSWAFVSLGQDWQKRYENPELKSFQVLKEG
jgi:hypothetical protein